MAHPQPRCATILAVEPRPADLSRLVQALDSPRRRCHGCQELDAAANLAQRLPPDLIVADVDVVGRGGCASCERLAGWPLLSRVPVVFLSAHQTVDVIRRAYLEGASYYLRKPFDPCVLSELVDCALSHFDSASRLRRDPPASSGEGKDYLRHHQHGGELSPVLARPLHHGLDESPARM